ncbi:MAG TPA: DUF5666 domain-containing protein [Verrucomicrobiae bacterium]|jgi:hypothetical protein|nr:DUF5666 domain-containing protein [Verrucomicrobiae bacterium]
MKKTKLLLMLGIVTLVYSGTAYSEVIEGKLTQVNQNENILSLSRISPKTKAEETVNMFVTNDTKYKGGAKSLADLEVGNDVRVEANQNNEGKDWRATEVERKSGESSSNGALEDNNILGKIEDLDKSAKTLTVKRDSAQSGQEEKVRLSVNGDTKYNGAESLDKLNDGDRISVEANRKNSSDVWTATEITKR